MDIAPHVPDELLNELLAEFGEEIFDRLISSNISFDEINIVDGGDSGECIQVAGGEDEEEEEDSQLVVISRGRSRLPRFRLDTHVMQYQIAPLPQGADPIEWTRGAFQRVYEEIIRAGQNGNNRFCMSFGFDGLNGDDAWERPRAIEGYAFDDLWNLVEKVSQSAGGFNVLDTFRIKLHVAEAPVGQGCHFDCSIKRHAGVLAINNPKDNLCLPRALVVASAYRAKEDAEATTGELYDEWKRIRHSGHRRQRDAAIGLVQAAGVCIPENGCGYEEIVKFQEYYAPKGTAIMVYTSGGDNKRDHPMLYDGSAEVIRLGLTVERILRVVFYPEEGHFDTIINLCSFQGYANYCEPCRKGHNQRSSHKCPAKCERCLKSPACPRDPATEMRCGDCRRYFYGQTCFDEHKRPGSYRYGKESVCFNIRYCSTCQRKLNGAQYKDHKCEKYRCDTCLQDRERGHFCFMPPVEKPKHSKKKRIGYVYYDFETRQEDTMPGAPTVNVHIPNLCVAQTVCDRCCNDDDGDMDGTGTHVTACCGIREFIFHGENCVEDFVNYINLLGSRYKKVVCIAHNAKAYDVQFILRELIKRKTEKISTIINGTNVTLLEYDNKKFIDSLNYLHMPLAALPKAFGLGDIAKGYFPHFFNTVANQNYVGPMPDKKYYSPETMVKDEEGLEKFNTWYDERVKENYVFDFQKELLFYCCLDVKILRRACNEFRNLIITQGNVCPFSECATIASTCLKIFQRNYLKKDEIGIIPRNGYRLSNTQSKIAIEWLTWVEHVEKIRITHALRGPEIQATENIRLDGYRQDNEKKYAYQFHGCYWHGCPRCFKYNRDKPLGTRKNDSLQSRYERTLYCTQELKHLQYTVTEMWECDFIREKKKNIELQNFLKNSKVLSITPLDPRDAFFGGRTGNTVTHYDANGETEQIRYVDVCSLYPWVLKNGVFPVGHPEVFVGPDCLTVCPNNDISNVEGLIKCRVLPPRNLFHPVLPVRAHGKLLFPLCRSCYVNMLQKDCPHNNAEDRELSGTWVTCELKEAVRMGYKILEITEIWSYKVTQYNPTTRQGGLFVEYINWGLRIKQEASGWPKECVDDASKDRYIAEYKRVEGIELNKEKIEKNSGLRSVAKLCLNSFWGKFAQRENMTKQTIVTTHEEFVHLMFNPEIEVTGLVPVNNETVFVSWKSVGEAHEPSNKANVVIAAFTTAQARLKLYGYLREKGDCVLYYDTDSVIYVSNGYNDLKTGNFLGDLTDEMEEHGVGSYISSFVSGGPKFYAFVVQKPDGTTKEVCKLKGVRLNFVTKQSINFSTVRDLVVNGADAFEIYFSGIRRTKYHQVVTKQERKKIKATGPKRRIVDDIGTTLPYGYKRVRLA